MRQPKVAGMFYEENKEKLIKQIENCYNYKLGPGKITENKENTITGIVAHTQDTSTQDHAQHTRTKH